MSARYAVVGAGVWTPTQPSLEAFASGAHATPSARPEATLLPARMRGRASLLTAMLANVIEQASAAPVGPAAVGGGPEPAVALDRAALPSVYGSAYGEMTTTLALLDQLHGEDGRLSPAKFQASVHNTAGGQLSIALGNRCFSTSLAAGRATVAMALLEAFAYLDERPGALLVACGDEAAVPGLDPSASYQPLAIGLAVANRPGYGRALAQLANPRVLQLTAADVVDWESAGVTQNPCAPGLAVISAIIARTPQRVLLPAAAGAALAIEVEAP